jgi:hypothetical protein
MTVTGPPDDYTGQLKRAAHEVLSMIDIVEWLRKEAELIALPRLQEAADEIRQLRLLVQIAVPFMNDAGNDEDPEAQTAACAWLEEARAALEQKP